jgi:transcriptional regulator with XRE-family HTH domain
MHHTGALTATLRHEIVTRHRLKSTYINHSKDASEGLDVDNVRFKGARHAARIDHHVGDRIRRRRTLLGYTQEQLADALDISYQQIQKYETGANRVSAGRLFQISQRLEVPITFFFDGLGIDFDQDPSDWANRSTIETIRALNQIPDAAVRTAVAGLVKALAATGEGAPAADRAGDANNGHASNRSNGSSGSNGRSHGNGGEGESDNH